MEDNYWFITYCFLSHSDRVIANNTAFFGNKYYWLAETRKKFPEMMVTILWADKITKDEYEYLREQDKCLTISGKRGFE